MKALHWVLFGSLPIVLSSPFQPSALVNLLKRALGFNALFTTWNSGNTRNNNPGFCTDNQLNELQAWTSDMERLVDVFLDSTFYYAEDYAMQDTLATFLGIVPNNDRSAPANGAALDDIRAWMTDVKNFLNTGNTNIAGQRNDLRLYCNDDALEWQDPYNEYLREYGTGTYVTDNAGDLTRLIDDPVAANKYTMENGVLTRGLVWIDDFKAYSGAIFTRGNPVKQCGAPGRIAFTTAGAYTPYIVICPVMWTYDRYPTLSGFAEPTGGEYLGAVQPRSAIFLHEVLHLIGINRDTADYVYTAPRCIAAVLAGNTYAAQHAPDCTMLAALAMYWSAQTGLSFATSLGRST